MEIHKVVSLWLQLLLLRVWEKKLDSVVLTEDIPEYGLEWGDISTVVLVHRNGEEYEVEFVTLHGDTVAVISLKASQIRPIGKKEIAHVRHIEAITI
jgi:hypothetical protein